MPRLVLLRHGQAAWNLEDRFAGWWDVALTSQGEEEAVAAGALLAAERITFDLCFTSLQARAIQTLNLALDRIGQHWVSVEKDWHFNERHYGALTGLTKAECAARYGRDQVKTWLRSEDIPPPPLALGSSFDLSKDRRYAGVAIPDTESLNAVSTRVMRCWEERIAPELAAGKNVFVVAHGNSVGSLVKHLSCLSNEEIAALGIPAGRPIVYDLSDDLNLRTRSYLDER